MLLLGVPAALPTRLQKSTTRLVAMPSCATCPMVLDLFAWKKELATSQALRVCNSSKSKPIGKRYYLVHMLRLLGPPAEIENQANCHTQCYHRHHDAGRKGNKTNKKTKREKRKTKNEKRKTKNEKRKTKTKKRKTKNEKRKTKNTKKQFFIKKTSRCETMTHPQPKVRCTNLLGFCDWKKSMGGARTTLQKPNPWLANFSCASITPPACFESFARPLVI